ncbi:CDK5RAP3-like protein [Diplonema papillatum]|nr:CDK5RAP3-like protein [Diplonema papillatum]
MGIDDLSDVPIDITYYKLPEWLKARSSVFGKKEKAADYEKLVEVAPKLAHVVKHEIPALKKTVAKSRKAQTDTEKRERELAVAISAATTRLKKACSEIGVQIDAVDYETEIQAAAETELQRWLGTVSSTARELIPAVEYYATFCAPKYEPNLPPSSGQLSSPLPTLSFIAREGNQPVYRLHQHLGTANLPRESDVFAIADAVKSGEPVVGDDQSDIDWGDSEDDVQPECAPGVHGEDIVDLDFTGGDDGEDAVGVSDLQRRLDQLRRPVLRDDETRTLFEDDLLELQGFLAIRCHEINKPSDACAAIAPVDPSGTDAGVVAAWLETVKTVTSRLADKSFSLLLLLSSSPLQAVRAARQLLQHRHEIARCKMLQQANTRRADDSLQTLASAQSELDELVGKAKMLQRDIETTLRKWFAPRKVYLVGDISNI